MLNIDIKVQLTQCLPTPDFNIGSQAFVKAQFFHTTWPLKKLTEKFLSPYEILA